MIDRRAFLTGVGSSALALTGARTLARAARRPVPRTLEGAIRGRVISRGSPDFAAAAHVFNERFDSVLPRAVARPIDTADMRAAVRWAVAHDVPFRARSGGHSYEGYSTLRDGVVLDLRELRGVSVDRAAGVAHVGAGAQLIDVYAGLARHGATIPAGSCPSVGIAGLTLGGGMGYAGRKLGLATDNLVAAEIVTADGASRLVDRHTDPDLLWALRGGGGGNFGIATRLTFRLHHMPGSASWFVVTWPWSSAADALDAWQHWARRAREELSSILHLQASAGTTIVHAAGQYLGPSGDLPGLLAALTAVPGASLASGDQDYLGLQLRWAGCASTGLSACHTSPQGALSRASFRAKSDFVTRPLPSQARNELVSRLEARLGAPGYGVLLLDSWGGAINRIAPHATAFVHRDALCSIQYLTYDGGSKWLGHTHAAMRPYVSGMAYQNYIDRDLQHWQRAYYGSNYPRLVEIRKRVDPDHRFKFPQAIGS